MNNVFDRISKSHAMKVTIITAVFNGVHTVDNCINSVLNQRYNNIEYIIVDGNSTDGTLEFIKKYENRITLWISEPDNGMYDALNKGIKMATGDVVGFLHADDLYASDTIINTIALVMAQNKVDSCYGDLLYVDKKDPENIIRCWKSNTFKEGLFQKGWMPPHPTFFVKREIYDKYGSFNTDFKIAADYELMLRFLEKYRISTYYIPEILIKMRIGGKSNMSLKNLFIKSTEDYKAWTVNDLQRRFYTIPFKNLSKIPQFFLRYSS